MSTSTLLDPTPLSSSSSSSTPPSSTSSSSSPSPSNLTTSPSSNPHGKPLKEMSCLCTMEDITEDDGNYVEYQCYPSMKWKPALFEKSIVETLLETQYHQYIKTSRTTECLAELKRLVKKGPPVYISDPFGLPLDNDDVGTEGGIESNGGSVCDGKNINVDGDNNNKDNPRIEKLWFGSDGKERSAMLHGSHPEGSKARNEIWNELKMKLAEFESGDGDSVEGVDKSIDE